MTEFVVSLIARGGYFGIFLLMAAENVFPPIPSEVIMGLGGFAVARGEMAIVPLVAAGTIGTVAGNFFWYELGYRLGFQRLKPFVDRWGRWLTVDWDDVVRLHRFFLSHGHWVIFVFRFLPVGRTIISLPAGMARMSRIKFALWTAGGSTIWNCILTGAGYYLGSNFQALDRYVGPAALAMSAAMLLYYGWRVVTWEPRGN